MSFKANFGKKSPGSTARARIQEYDRARQSSRNVGTKSNFGSVGREVDAESEKPKLPTYAFADRQKGVVDSAADDARPLKDELKALKKDDEHEIVDKDDFVKKKDPIVHRQAHTATTSKDVSDHLLGGPFAKAWTVVDHIMVPPVIQPTKSWYLPSAIAMFKILSSCEKVLDGNNRLKEICPHYFSLPVRIYYSVLFYIQILSAKEACNVITKTESSWFRTFKRHFKPESLPVIGPLVPYFANLAAIKPNDDKYEYVYPNVPEKGIFSVASNVPTVEDAYFFMPSVPTLAGLLRQFCTLTNTQLTSRTGNGFDYFDADESFVPHSVGGNFRFMGIDFVTNLSAQQSRFMANIALDAPLPEIKRQVVNLHAYWRKSACKDIPEFGADQDYSNIADFMCMKEKFEWFEPVVHMATVQARFFSDSRNMSQLSPFGGNEVLVSSQVTGKSENYVAATDWYPQNWTTLKSQFRTTRADTSPDQFFNAAYALTLSSISWTTGGHPIGGKQVGHREGPYWANREMEYELENSEPVLRGLDSMIQSQFYDFKGKVSY